MRFGLRRVALACLVAVGAIVFMAPGGTATNNRDGVATFVALPGPASVTFGKNIAYSATLDNTNTSGSVFTQVTFHQSRPVATFGGTGYPSPKLIAASCNARIDDRGTADLKDDELTCTFAQLRPEDAPLKVTVVWQAPTIPSAGCTGCLSSQGSWTIKENKTTNGNESFPPEGPIVVPASLLGGTGTAETQNAGSYELGACKGGNPNLSTNQDVNVSNPVTTSFCLPAFNTSGSDIGLATTIFEGLAESGDPGVSGFRSDVCIAALGEDCAEFGDYTPFNFGTGQITLVFQIANDALLSGVKITQVFHNGDPDPLPSCADDPDNANGCVVSIDLSKGKVKIWTIIVKSSSNGFYNW